jgi:hypothetical protein
VDPADLLVVDEIDWQDPPAELEAAAVHSLRQRLVTHLARRQPLRRFVPRANLGRVRRGGAAIGASTPCAADSDQCVVITPAACRSGDRTNQPHNSNELPP